MLNVLIVGTGHIGQALCRLYQERYAAKRFHLKVATSSPEKAGQTLYGCIVESNLAALMSTAEIVILAIPGHVILSFARQHQASLRGKIIVDCSNAQGNGKALADLLEECDAESASTSTSVIKAFTNIDVFNIMDEASSSITSSAREATIVGNNEAALEKLIPIMTALGFRTLSVPDMTASDALVSANLKRFPKWRQPFLLALLLVVGFAIYAIIDRNLAYGAPWYSQGIQTLNAAVCCAAITLLGGSGVLGALAVIVQNVLGRNLAQERDSTFTRQLNYRKQVGLISIWLLSVHAILSAMLFSLLYCPYFTQVQNGERQLTGIGSLSLSAGILGFCAYLGVGITSLPSVAKTLGMTEWVTVQSYIGWGALALAVVHVLSMGYGDLITTMDSGLKIPSLFAVAACLPVLAFVTKAVAYVTDGWRYIRRANCSVDSCLPCVQSCLQASVGEQQLLINSRPGLQGAAVMPYSGASPEASM